MKLRHYTRWVVMIAASILAVAALAACGPADDEPTTMEPEPMEPATMEPEPMEPETMEPETMEPEETAGAYAGERIEIVNPFSLGGGTGSWLVLLIPYLQEHIPGEPTIEQVSRSGGSGLNGPNHFENNTDSSGNFLLASSGSNVFPFLFNQEGVMYDFADYTAVLGSPVGGVVYTSPTTNISDANGFCSADGLIYGAISATGLDIVLLAALNILDSVDAGPDGEGVRVILGFEGRGDPLQSLQAGDISLDYQTSSNYIDQVAPAVEMGNAVPLFSFGILGDDGDIIRDPTFPELPHFGEVYEECEGSELSGVELEAYKALLTAGFAAQKNLWVKSDVPQSQIDALIEGATAVVADPDFLEDSKEKVGEYEFSVGQAAQAKFDAANSLSDEAYTWIRTFLSDVYDVEIPARS